MPGLQISETDGFANMLSLAPYLWRAPRLVVCQYHDHPLSVGFWAVITTLWFPDIASFLTPTQVVWFLHLCPQLVISQSAWDLYLCHGLRQYVCEAVRSGGFCCKSLWVALPDFPTVVESVDITRHEKCQIPSGATFERDEGVHCSGKPSPFQINAISSRQRATSLLLGYLIYEGPFCWVFEIFIHLMSDNFWKYWLNHMAVGQHLVPLGIPGVTSVFPIIIGYYP